MTRTCTFGPFSCHLLASPRARKSRFWPFLAPPVCQDGNPSKSSDQKRNRLLRGVYKQHFHRRDGSAGSKGAPRGCSLGPRPARTALNGSAMAAMQHFHEFAGRVPTFCRQKMRIPARKCTNMMRFLHISRCCINSQNTGSGPENDQISP